MQLLFIIHIAENTDSLAQHADALHLADKTVCAADLVPDSREVPVQILIGLLLVLEAAHQPSAHAGYFARIQGQILLLGHPDGDRNKIIQIRCAAERPAARTVAAEHAGLIADADLTQFDAGAEHGGEVLDEVAEINPPVSREIEHDLAAIKRIFRRNQLHLKSMLFDLLPGDAVCLPLLLPVSGISGIILRRCHPDHRPKRLAELLLCHDEWIACHRAILQAAGCFHDHMHSAADLPRTGREVIDLPRAAETDADYLRRCLRDASTLPVLCRVVAAVVFAAVPSGVTAVWAAVVAHFTLHDVVHLIRNGIRRIRRLIRNGIRRIRRLIWNSVRRIRRLIRNSVRRIRRLIRNSVRRIRRLIRNVVCLIRHDIRGRGQAHLSAVNDHLFLLAGFHAEARNHDLLRRRHSFRLRRIALPPCILIRKRLRYLHLTAAGFHTEAWDLNFLFVHLSTSIIALVHDAGSFAATPHPFLFVHPGALPAYICHPQISAPCRSYFAAFAAYSRAPDRGSP